MNRLILILMAYLFCYPHNLYSQSHEHLIKSGDYLPDKSLNLRLKAPIQSWDEAIPLGNGITGGLLWGEKNTLRLSLDRGDIWDERLGDSIMSNWWKIYNYPKAIKEIAEGKSVNAWWDTPYIKPTPTKLPAGRIEILFSQEDTIQSFELDLAKAQGNVKLKRGEVQVVYHANEKYTLVRIKNTGNPEVKLMTSSDVFDSRMEFLKAKKGDEQIDWSSKINAGTFNKLGYPNPEKHNANNYSWYVQQAAGGLKYAVCIRKKVISESEIVLAIAITTTNDAADVLALAKQRCNEALQDTFDQTIGTHKKWWSEFWNKSAVSIPDSALLKQYYLTQYLYGAGSHAQTPPLALQGVWTCDDGNLPPWKGDYHSDLNTQMTYIAYQTSGRLNEGYSYLNFLFKRRTVFEQFAKDFYQTDGLSIPGVMSYGGQPLGGWGMYSLSPTMSAWNAHLFYMHWKYSMDKLFLQAKAYPFCSEIGTSLLQLLKEDKKSHVLVLPLSSSPEIYDNTMDSWLIPNSNYDIACAKILFYSLKEMALALNKTSEADKWGQTALALGNFHTENDTLLIDAKKRLPYSHRHLSNLIGIYPFNLISINDANDKKMIDASIQQWEKLGTRNWCGYSFGWMSCLRARIGDSEGALRYIHTYLDGFILRNGFHCNGDQSGKNYSDLKYRPFTLEGNFLASQAVHEMLLQSWSSIPGAQDTEMIRIFPAVSHYWGNVSFSDLRTEGAHKVSAIRENTKIKWFKLVAGKDGMVRIYDNFGGKTPKWNLNVKKTKDHYEVYLKKGHVIEAQFE